jgi:putative phage-type endonuclease
MFRSATGLDLAAWHEWRRAGVGGSDAGTIAGLSPWRSPLAIWLEKTGRTQPEVRAQESPWKRWGRRLEPVMADEFEELRGLVVGHMGVLCERDDMPWQRATLDGLVYESQADLDAGTDQAIAVLELKTSSWRSPLSWEEGVPKLYAAQVQHELMVTGLPMAYLAVLHDGSRFEIYELEAEPEVIAALSELEEDFWRCVQEDTPPAIDSKRSTEEAVRQAYAESIPGAYYTLSDDHVSRARAYASLQRQRSAIDAEMVEHRLALMVAMGDHEIGLDTTGAELLTWKTYESKSVDMDALKTKHPRLVERFTRRTPSRRFLIKQAARGDEEA